MAVDRFRILVALLVTALISAPPSLAQVLRQETPSISMHLDSVTIDQAIKQLALVSGQKIVLAGSYSPKDTVSLNLNGVPLDEALRRLLKSHNYYILDDANRRFIYITGEMQGGPEDKAQGEGKEQSIDLKGKQTNQQEIDAYLAHELVPKIKQSRYKKTGPGNTVDIVRDVAKFWNIDHSQYRHGHLPDGSGEVLPQTEQGNYDDYTKITAITDKPTVELIGKEAPPNPEPGGVQTNSDKTELLPPGIK